MRVQHGADFSVARTCFGLIIKHRPDLCQIGGMISPDKKDSFRVIYFKNRALKDLKKNVSIRHHLPFYKNYPRQKKPELPFLFLKQMAAKMRRSYQRLTNAGSFFPPPESGPRKLRPHLFGVFLLSPLSVFIKRNTVARA